MKDIRNLIRNKIVVFDGGMGTLLQSKGLKPGELPERWNISHKDTILGIHKDYLDAGAEITTTNTFGLNSLKYSHEEIREIAAAAVENARMAGAEIVAYDIGPCGRMLKPWGDFSFEDAVELFKEQALLAEELGADLVLIETMADSYETKAALVAVKENTNLPVFVDNAYGMDGKLLTGASPKAMVAMLEGLGADAIGANCSLGPRQLLGITEEIAKYASVPVVIRPNAGLPVIRDGKTCYDVEADEFAQITASMAELGVSVFGGCCGTTPEHIRLLREKLKKVPFNYAGEKSETLVSSYAQAVQISSALNAAPVIVGERINPSGNKLLKAAINGQDWDYVIKLGLEQESAGADVLDVNMGLPGTDEAANLSRIVCEMQAVSSIPLSIDSSNYTALEKAVRLYNGKPIINSVNGTKESLDAVLPIAAKYGGVLVCLCLDDDGIPDDAEGRFAIAKNIVNAAASYGISKKDLIFDALTLPVSASPLAPAETLKTLRLIREELGCSTILGVSNVSFGLPGRAKLNAAFFAEALNSGLSAGIVSPLSADIMSSYYTFLALHGLDEGFGKYIKFADKLGKAAPVNTGATLDENMDLKTSIIKGLKRQASKAAKEDLKTIAPLDVIDTEIVPALDYVGKAYEENRMYLPQLLLSAEAAQAAFEEIKLNAKLSPDGAETVARTKFVIATVKGDIHDLGKNIVKLLLENYGFDVIDLGKDVPPEKILEAIEESGACLCGLSALMTTTVPAMELSIKMIKDKFPQCKIVVGGAVLTQQYADSIGADFYAKDAMATVRYSKENS